MRSVRLSAPFGGITVALGTALALVSGASAPAQQAESEPFVATLTVEEMSGKQLVLDTDLGTIAVDLRPDLAPNHVGLIMRLVEQGAYDGTTFHRMVANAICQGGDPFTADPERPADYGRGGLGLVDGEMNAPHVRGTVSAVVVPGDPNSGGAQFLICVVDQPGPRRAIHRLGPGRGRHGCRDADLRDPGRRGRARRRAGGGPERLDP